MFSIEVTEDTITPTLEHYRRQWENLAPPLREANKIVAQAIDEAYKTRGGGSWPPRKDEGRYTYPPLQRTGMMRGKQIGTALTNEPVQHGDEWTLEYDEVIEATPYSRFHQEGTRTMPARQTVMLGPHHIDRIHNLLAAYVFD